MKMSGVVRRALRALVVGVLACAPIAVVAPRALANAPDVLIPPVRKVDLQGKQIEGASWNFEWCTNWSNDGLWDCMPGDDYERPLIGDTRDGSLNGSNFLNDNIPVRGSSSVTATMVVTVWETAPPTGYLLDPRKYSYSYMCGAWVPGNAVQNPGLTCDPAALPEGTLPKDGTEPIVLTNRREVPRVHSTQPRLAKVDQDGASLTGATVQGWHCTRWDNDIDWSCSPLGGTPTIDPAAWPTYLIDEVPSRIPSTPTMPENYNGNDRIIMWESAAPAGYTLSSTMYAVEYACGAWRSIPVTGRTEAAAKAPAVATCASAVLKDNTFRWVNTKVVTPTTTAATPTTTAAVVPSTPSKPAPTTAVPVLAQSGLPHDDLGLYLAWSAGLILTGATLTAAARRAITAKR